ncbi:MAG: radical SAM protein [Candidatus Micrarchaeia archaeon]
MLLYLVSDVAGAKRNNRVSPPGNLMHLATMLMDQPKLGLKELKADFGFVLVARNESRSMRSFFGYDQPDMVAMGVYETELPGLANLCKKIRIHWPETEIVVGGPLATVIPRTVLSVSKANILCRGEADLTFREVVERRAAGKDILGIDGVLVRRNDGTILEHPNSEVIPRIPLSMLENIAMHPEVIRLILEESGSFLTPAIFSRGCAYGNCSFCSVDSNKWRMLSPEIVREQLAMLKTFGRKIGIRDTLFGGPRSVLGNYVRTLEGAAEEIAVSMSVDQFLIGNAPGNREIDIDVMDSMFRAGIRMISMGVESLTDSMLKRLKHSRYTADEAIRVLVTLGKKGFVIRSNLILTDAETTDEELKTTVDSAATISEIFRREKMDVVLRPLSAVSPCPGTPYYDKFLASSTANGGSNRFYGQKCHPGDPFPYYDVEPEANAFPAVRDLFYNVLGGTAPQSSKPFHFETNLYLHYYTMTLRKYLFATVHPEAIMGVPQDEADSAI